MLLTIISTIIIFFIYNLWIMANFDKNGNPKTRKKGKKVGRKDVEKKMPSEVKFFVQRYNIDLDKVNYRYFLRAIGFVVALDISIIATIVGYINSLWLQIVLIFVLVIAAIFVSFELLGKYFKKKGLTRDD